MVNWEVKWTAKYFSGIELLPLSLLNRKYQLWQEKLASPLCWYLHTSVLCREWNPARVDDVIACMASTGSSPHSSFLLWGFSQCNICDNPRIKAKQSKSVSPQTLLPRWKPLVHTLHASFTKFTKEIGFSSEKVLWKKQPLSEEMNRNELTISSFTLLFCIGPKEACDTHFQPKSPWMEFCHIWPLPLFGFAHLGFPVSAVPCAITNEE